MSACLFPLLIRDARDGDEGVARTDVVAEAIHPPHGVQLFGLDIGTMAVDGRFDEAVLHIHGDDAAEDDA